MVCVATSTQTVGGLPTTMCWSAYSSQCTVHARGPSCIRFMREALLASASCGRPSLHLLHAGGPPCICFMREALLAFASCVVMCLQGSLALLTPLLRSFQTTQCRTGMTTSCTTRSCIWTRRREYGVYIKSRLRHCAGCMGTCDVLGVSGVLGECVLCSV